MFDIDQLVTRLRRIGSDTHDVEAKSAAGGLPESLPSTLSAFANMPGGGIVVLGLDESKGFRPVRIDRPALKSSAASMVRQALQPPPTVEFLDVEFDGHELLVIAVSELHASAKPCVVRRSGKSYLRSWDGDFELSSLEVQGLLTARSQPRFDSETVPGVGRKELNESLVVDYLAMARETDRGLARLPADDDLLARTGVINKDGVPTVAGLLALGVYPQQWFPNFVIQAATSPAPGAPPGTRVGDVARFSGPLPQMIDDALIWIARHSKHRIVTDVDGRVRDEYDLPSVAVRELLSNALVHRDLADWSWSRAIELRISEDQLRLVNPGGLYGISSKRLLDNQLTSARNLTLMRICQFVRLRDRRVVEALATGIPLILEATERAGLPAPTFFDQGLTFTAILHRGYEDRGLVARQRNAPATSTERRVLAALRTRPQTQVELAAALNMSAQALRKHLRSLRRKGLLDVDGGPGNRSTRYSSLGG